MNPTVNAIVTLVKEMAAEDAARADEKQARNETLGRLHGLELSLILRQAVKSQKSWNGDFGSWEYIDGSSREK